MPWECAFALQINAYRNFWINFTAKAKKVELYLIASYKTIKQCFSSWSLYLEEMGVYTGITVRGHNVSHSQLLINSSHSQPKMCADWPWQFNATVVQIKSPRATADFHWPSEQTYFSTAFISILYTEFGIYPLPKICARVLLRIRWQLWTEVQCMRCY